MFAELIAMASLGTAVLALVQWLSLMLLADRESFALCGAAKSQDESH